VSVSVGCPTPLGWK